MLLLVCKGIPDDAPTTTYKKRWRCGMRTVSGTGIKIAAAIAAFSFSGAANAVIYTTAVGEMVDVPGGPQAFADAVVDYQPNINFVAPDFENPTGQEPAPGFVGPDQALGDLRAAA